MMRLILFLVLISTSVFGDVFKPEWVKANHTTINLNEKNNVSYPLVRLERKGASPVLLLHGFSSNNASWMDIAPDIYNAGYDVWCLDWNANHDRDLQATGEQTVKEMVEHIVEKTGQKVFIIGHSFGGVLAKIYTYGIQMDTVKNVPFINLDLQKKALRNVKGVGSVASPNGVGFSSLFQFHFLYKFYHLVPFKYKLRSYDLGKAIKRNKVNQEELIVKSLEMSAISARTPIVKNIFNGLFNFDYHDLNDYSIGKMARYALSRVSKAVDSETASYDRFPYQDIFMMTPRVLPMAFVSAEYDILADFNSIKVEADSSDYLELPRAGHLDPLFGELQRQTSDFLISFLNKNN